jgi:hypothetical protein
VAHPLPIAIILLADELLNQEIPIAWQETNEIEVRMIAGDGEPAGLAPPAGIHFRRIVFSAEQCLRKFQREGAFANPVRPNEQISRCQPIRPERISEILDDRVVSLNSLPHAAILA